MKKPKEKKPTPPKYFLRTGSYLMGFKGFYDDMEELKAKVFKIIDRSTIAERLYIKNPRFKFLKWELEASIHITRLDLDKISKKEYEKIYQEEGLKNIYRTG